MNILHWYWLRYSGIPAYVGRGLARSPDAVRGKLILESSAEDTPFYTHVDRDAWADTVFFATYSYTEADMASRQRFREVVKSAGVVFLVFWPTFMGVDNDVFLGGILDESLQETHNVQVWKHEAVGFYLVARRKDLGPVLCLPEANCYWYTAHYSLPYGGLRRSLMKLGIFVAILGLLFWQRSRGTAFGSFVGRLSSSNGGGKEG